MTEVALTKKIKHLWSEFEKVIKPLEQELKLKGVTEHVNKYYIDKNEDYYLHYKIIYVKSYLLTNRGDLKYKCIVVTKKSISEEIKSEQDFYEECSKEEFDNYFTNTLQTILK